MQPGTVIERCEGSSPSSPPKFYVGNGEIGRRDSKQKQEPVKLGYKHDTIK